MYIKKEQMPELCLEAVKQNGLALEFVKEEKPKFRQEVLNEEGAVVIEDVY